VPGRSRGDPSLHTPYVQDKKSPSSSGRRRTKLKSIFSVLFQACAACGGLTATTPCCLKRECCGDVLRTGSLCWKTLPVLRGPQACSTLAVRRKLRKQLHAAAVPNTSSLTHKCGFWTQTSQITYSIKHLPVRNFQIAS